MKKPLKILHLVGDHEDAGGVLSVIRNLQKVTPASSMEHAVWVKEGYRESRKPPLQYRYSRYVVGNPFTEVGQAWPAFKELNRCCQTNLSPAARTQPRNLIGGHTASKCFGVRSCSPITITHSARDSTGGQPGNPASTPSCLRRTWLGITTF